MTNPSNLSNLLERERKGSTPRFCNRIPKAGQAGQVGQALRAERDDARQDDDVALATGRSIRAVNSRCSETAFSERAIEAVAPTSVYANDAEPIGAGTEGTDGSTRRRVAPSAPCLNVGAKTGWVQARPLQWVFRDDHELHIRFDLIPSRGVPCR